MSKIKDLIQNIFKKAPTDWTFVENLPDPGLGISDQPVEEGECYVELYVESLRLSAARKFTTTFNGAIYAFMRLPQFGSPTAELAAISKPEKLAEVDPNNLDRVITVSKRLIGRVPWHGGPLGLELGLFSIKQKELLTPILNYVVSVSDLAGVSQITQIKPFLPLIEDGLALLSGQTEDTKLEIGLDQDIDLSQTRISAVIAAPRGSFDATNLTLDPVDRKLLSNGQPVDTGYFVFSIRAADRKPDWADIEDLKTKFDGVAAACNSGRRAEVEKALTVFANAVYSSRELIAGDKQRLVEKAKQWAAPYLAGGLTAAETAKRGEKPSLAVLDLYDDAA